MCGIIFTINTVPHTANLDDFMSNGLIASQVRGMDSTGMFQVKRTKNKDGDQEVEFFKKDVHASDYISETAAGTILRAANNAYLTVGHVRAATNGSVTTKNAHPFIAKRDDDTRIIGVHNGSLVNWRGKEGSDGHEVDSQWLFDRLAKDGADAFEAFDGAFALVWFDSRHQDKVFLARNDKRPLFYATTEDGKAMIAASELGMLGWMADREGIKLQKDKDGHRFYYPQPGHIMEISLKDLSRKTFKYTEFNAASKLYVKPAPPVTQVSYPPVQHPLGRGPQSPLGRNDNRFDLYRDGEQKKMLDAIKTALKTGAVRAAAPDDEEIEEESVVVGGDFEDTTGFEAAIAREIQQYQDTNKKMDLPEGDFAFVENPTDKNASFAERDRAKRIGIYGLVVDFSGYFVDPSEGIVYGGFSTVENGEAFNYEAIVRGQSEKAGDAKYVHPAKTVPMAVIGVADKGMVAGSKPMIVLTDLKAEWPIIHYESIRELANAARTIH